MYPTKVPDWPNVIADRDHVIRMADGTPIIHCTTIGDGSWKEVDRIVFSEGGVATFLTADGDEIPYEVRFGSEYHLKNGRVYTIQPLPEGGKSVSYEHAAKTPVFSRRQRSKYTRRKGKRK